MSPQLLHFTNLILLYVEKTINKRIGKKFISYIDTYYALNVKTFPTFSTFFDVFFMYNKFIEKIVRK